MILIKDHWDDWFQFETQYYLYYIDSSGEAQGIGSVKIGQLDMQQDQRSARISNSFTSLPDNCFSLGQGDLYYERIKNLGEDIRIDALSSLHDIAYDMELFKKVKNLSVTRTSLMRDIGEFTVKQQYSRIAQGSARLTCYDIEYTYPCENTDHPAQLFFSVKPESNPPTNIQVIIGRNSVGKTYLIKNIIGAIYIPNDSNHYGILRSTNSSTGRMVNSKTQPFANVLCVSFSPFDNYEEIIGLLSKKKAMPFSYIGLTGENLYDNLCDNFIDSLNRCQKSERKISLLESALVTLETDPIFEEANIRRILKPENEIKGKEEMKNNLNEALKLFKKLSSGHQVIILTLFQLVDKITEKSLVILDEPENHLHPPLLAAFIRALSELLIDQNGVAIIATHSPVILQEVPKSCIWKINRCGAEVSPSRLDIESFGATIGALTREVFGLEVNKSGFNKMLSDLVDKGYKYDEISEQFNNELGDEAKALLRTLLLLKDDENETTE